MEFYTPAGNSSNTFRGLSGDTYGGEVQMSETMLRRAAAEYSCTTAMSRSKVKVRGGGIVNNFEFTYSNNKVYGNKAPTGADYYKP